MHYVIEMNLDRDMVAMIPFETREKAQAHVWSNAFHTLLPSYTLRSYEEAADVEGFELLKDEDDDDTDHHPDPDMYTGFSFDGGKYIVCVSDFLGYNLKDQHLFQVRARPVYWVRPSLRKPSPESQVVVVTFEYIYGGQGGDTRLGVYATPEIAVCELWRNTFGTMDGYGNTEDTGGNELTIISVFILELDGIYVRKPDPGQTLMTADSFETGASESEAWIAFRAEVVRELAECLTSSCKDFRQKTAVSSSTVVTICDDSEEGMFISGTLGTGDPTKHEDHVYTMCVNTTLT
jgi:hypothetical protein